MEAWVTAALAISLWAYVVMGGADFGVGILELFASREERPALRKEGERAIAPIWEANHIWIIVVLVVLFVAFPPIHVQLATSLHIPLVLMLIGIVLRGTAFTFRYYDAEGDNSTLRLWSVLFRSGSVLVPVVFGHIVAAMAWGRIASRPTDAWDGYVMSWLGVFPAATGVFVASLFAWLAAVFLVSEATPERRDAAIQRARRWTVVLLGAGGWVTATGWYEGVSWLASALTKPATIWMLVLSTGGLGGLWVLLPSQKVGWMRGLAAAVVAGILGGYWFGAYPVALELGDGAPLTWHEAAAPPATLRALGIALAFALAFIVPGLIVLFRLFKSSNAATVALHASQLPERTISK